MKSNSHLQLVAHPEPMLGRQKWHKSACPGTSKTSDNAEIKFKVPTIEGQKGKKTTTISFQKLHAWGKPNSNDPQMYTYQFEPISDTKKKTSKKDVKEKTFA